MGGKHGEVGVLGGVKFEKVGCDVGVERGEEAADKRDREDRIV